MEIEFNKLDIENISISEMSFLKRVRPFYTSDIIKWQYSYNNNNSGLFLGYDKDIVFAAQGMIPITLSLKDKFLLSAKSESSLLDENYRGKGLFEEIYDKAISASEADEIKTFWGFTKVTVVWGKKLKFETYENIMTETHIQLGLFNELKSIQFNKSFNIYVSQLGKALAKKLNRIIKKKSKSTDIVVDTADLNNEHDVSDIIKIFEKWKNKYPDYISINLSQTYLEWRLMNNPVCAYSFFKIKCKNELVGFAIVNVTTPRFQLVEYIMLNNELDGLIGLMEILNKKGGVTLNYFSNKLNSYNNLVSNSIRKLGGRTNVNNVMHFVLRHLEKNELSEVNIQNYYINSLWTEGFRM